MTIAVAIVTFDNAGHIGANLRALEQQLDERDELIVVDNASHDGTAEAARAASPRARVLEQEKNLGFAGGCQAAAACAEAMAIVAPSPMWTAASDVSVALSLQAVVLAASVAPQRFDRGARAAAPVVSASHPGRTRNEDDEAAATDGEAES